MGSNSLPNYIKIHPKYLPQVVNETQYFYWDAHKLVHLKYGSLIVFLLAIYKSWKALAFI